MSLKFSDYFWGKNSFDVLSLHLSKGKESLKLFSSIMIERSKAEMKYVQSLESILKLATKLSDYPGFEEPFGLIKRSIEDTIMIHSGLIPVLKDEIGQFVESFKEEQKRKRKLVLTESQKLVNEHKTMEVTHSKFKEKYFKFAKENEVNQMTYNEPSRKAKSTKEQLKIAQKAQKSQIEMEKSEYEYNDHSNKFSSFMPLWESKIENYLNELQQQEEERIQHLKQQCIKYGHSLGQLEPIIISSQIIEKSENINIENEINSFINEKQTGTIRPIAPSFEQYISNVITNVNTISTHPSTTHPTTTHPTTTTTTNTLPTTPVPSSSIPQPVAYDSNMFSNSSSSSSINSNNNGSNILRGSNKSQSLNLNSSNEQLTTLGHPPSPKSQTNLTPPTPSTNSTSTTTISSSSTSTSTSSTAIPIFSKFRRNPNTATISTPFNVQKTTNNSHVNAMTISIGSQHNNNINERPTSSISIYNNRESLSPPLCYVRMIFDYNADDPNELSASIGQIIAIFDKDPSGWWTGELNGKVGLIPSNYVEEIDTPH